MELSPYQMQGLALLGISAMLLCFAAHSFTLAHMDFRSLLTHAKTLLESKTIRWGALIAATGIFKLANITAGDVDQTAGLIGTIIDSILALVTIWAGERVISHRANTQRLFIDGQWQTMEAEAPPQTNPEKPALEKVVIQRIERANEYPEQNLAPKLYDSKEDREKAFQEWRSKANQSSP